MELDNNAKREALSVLLKARSVERFQAVSMGQAWNEIGNKDMEAECAKSVATVSQMIDFLQKKLDGIPTE